MELDMFYNEDCFLTMSKIEDKSIDLVLTSPPYNMTKRKGGYADKQPRYDVYTDWKSDEDYIDWSIKLFNEFDRILKPNKVILYNFSYSIENPVLPYQLVSEIFNKSNLTIADTIIWKKPNSIPHPASYNRLNRIVEFVFVFCRKTEMKSFEMHKKIKSVGSNGQKYYEILDNFFTAKNNSETTTLNKATYSVDFCDILLSWYGTNDYIVYDPFMGTGTTAVSCKKNNMFYIGSEISEQQVIHSKNRLTKTLN
jgi:site-specific DNA-methyltransferase (adenine-specific)/modification methylase